MYEVETKKTETKKQKKKTKTNKQKQSRNDNYKGGVVSLIQIPRVVISTTPWQEYIILSTLVLGRRLYILWPGSASVPAQSGSGSQTTGMRLSRSRSEHSEEGSSP